MFEGVLNTPLRVKSDIYHFFVSECKLQSQVNFDEFNLLLPGVPYLYPLKTLEDLR